MQLKTENAMRQVLKLGQSLWYDGLIAPAEFRRMIEEDGLRGATTNPAIFEKALAGHEYDARIRELLKTQNEAEIFKTLAVAAVRDVANVFLPVYQETRGLDGYVSLEVSPLLAYDADATIREARELWRLVNHPNVMIKIPATRQSLPAIETALCEGINVNVTLIFSVERYREVMDAYIRGLERRAGLGMSVSEIASVASFFVSRVDSAVDKMLEAKIAASSGPAQDQLKALVGRAAIANSKAAYEEFKRVFSGARFQKLQSKGAILQRPLWASTGTKNPAFSDVLYVESLIGPDTVNTMPPATLAAFCDHGTAASAIENDMEGARAVLGGLKDAGIDLLAVTQDLEKAGVELFCDAYRKIIQAISAKK